MRKIVDHATEAKIAKLYQSGRNGGELGRLFGVAKRTIYDVLARVGVARRTQAKSITGKLVGAKNPNWQGGVSWSHGYKYIRVSPNKRVKASRLMMERMLRRKLKPGEIVHHKDGDTTNDSPDNLELLPSQSEHNRRHMTSKKARMMAKIANDRRYGRSSPAAVESLEVVDAQKDQA